MDLSHTAVAVGDNCIDSYLYPVRRSFVGGNAVNVAIAMHRCGITTSYIGAVGTDANGQRVMSELRAEGIDVSMVQVIPGCTGVTTVELRDGDRVFLKEELGVMRDFRLDAAAFEFITRHRLVHNTHLGHTRQYVEAFKRAGLTVSFDYSNMQDEGLLRDTLAFVDIAFISAPSGDIAATEKLAKELAERGPHLVIATMGAAGSLAFDQDRVWYQPAAPIGEVVDTLGAGDAFIGTFLGGWLQEKPMDTILREATARAGEACRHFGAWVPAMSERGV